MEPDEIKKLENGQEAPDFALFDLEGKKFSLKELRGRVALLNFWSAECPWSERVDRELKPALERWGERVTLLSIAANANEPAEMLKETAAQRDFGLVLRDPDHAVADRYGAVTTPHFFVIDGSGVLRYQGAYDDVTFRQRKPTREFLVPAVEAVLRGEEPQPEETPPFGCTIVRYGE